MGNGNGRLLTARPEPLLGTPEPRKGWFCDRLFTCSLQTEVVGSSTYLTDSRAWTSLPIKEANTGRGAAGGTRTAPRARFSTILSTGFVDSVGFASDYSGTSSG